MRQVGVFNDTTVTQHYGCHAVMTVLTRELKEVGLVPRFFIPVGCNWKQIKKQICEEKIDAIIVNGEGTVHHTDRRERARNLTELGFFAKHELGVPAVLLNASLYALDSIALRNLKGYDEIFVRESSSLSYLTRENILASLVPDLSFFHNSNHSLYGQYKGNDTILVTDSTIKSRAAELKKIAVKNHFNFLAMRPERRCFIKRIPHNLRGLARNKNFWQRSSIYENLRRETSPMEDFENFVALLSSAQGVLTGRFHSTTLSLSARVPLLAIESNTPKVGSLLRDVLGGVERLIELDEISGSNSVSIPPYDISELRRIDAYLTEGHTLMKDMFRRIETVVNRRKCGD